MGDFYIRLAIWDSESIEELDSLLNLFNSDERDMDLTILGLQTRVRLLEQALRNNDSSRDLDVGPDEARRDDAAIFDTTDDPMDAIDQSGGRMEKRRHDELDSSEDVNAHSPKRQRTLSSTGLPAAANSPVLTDLPPNTKPLYRIKGVSEVNVQKFKTRGMNYDVQFSDIAAHGVDELHPILNNAFEGIIDDITTGMPAHDQVRLVLSTNQLDYPIALPFMRRDQLTAERLLSRVEQVLQSHESFTLNETVHINFYHVSMPQGSGSKRRRTINLQKHLSEKRCIIQIQNDDALCLARALVVAKAKLSNDPAVKQIANSRRPLQRRLAEQLHHDAGVLIGPCGLEEVKRFQEHLQDYQINIVSAHLFNAVIYSGPDKDQRIYLYHHDNHYDVITSMPAFFSRKLFCHHCNKAYDHDADHICKHKCNICFKGPCDLVKWIYCEECNRYFKNQQCFDNHNQLNEAGSSLCLRYVKCKFCHKIIKRINQEPEAHHCGEIKCNTCKQFADPDHQCYMQPVDDESENANSNTNDPKFLFFDYETTQETGTHIPNLIIVQNQNGDEHVFNGENANIKFCNWLFSAENEDAICFAHNLQKFDGYFILSYLNKQGICPSVIMNGGKILSIDVREQNIKFLDSMAFLPMRLSAFPKTFGFDELKKGYFPHHFNTPNNQSYIGPLPDASFYDPDGMSPSVRDQFYQWYNDLKSRNYEFNMEIEITEYCRSDVDILRKSCLEFRRLFMETTDIDPFAKCITIASACNLVFRKNFLQPNTIAIIPPLGYRPQDKQSAIALKWLSYVSEKENIYIRHARNTGEQRIGPYRVDGFHEGSNTVYEFNGDFWHGCKCFARGTKNPINGKTMQELYKETLQRRDYLIRQGYKVVEKWECELKKELSEDPEIKEYFDKNVIATEPLEPRHALFGGRTNATRLYYKAQESEKIKYVDFTRYDLYDWFCNLL
ncbi:uncharacterized protein LOC110247906 [Exaiptasia diaphana]|uniref:DNA-directed DNA polymerase n=1 Tax=Exaiptasia diaphana TaxID=2652724 RepID=A0A913YRD2_EXADI|nr:uncharacterized protein LOC110247906 [Exaiptasia diaphana]